MKNTTQINSNNNVSIEVNNTKSATCQSILKFRQIKLSPFVFRLNSILKNHYSDISFDVACLSNRLFLCPMQVYRKIKRYTGLTPGKYLLLYRLDKAINLILTTENSIGEIAFQVGFNNQNNFSRAFKRELGISPMQFRINAGEDVINRLKKVML